MVHYSKKDWWLIAIVAYAVIIPLTLGLIFLFLGAPYRTIGIALTIDGAITVAVILLLCYPLYYQVDSLQLIVRCGVLINRRIPLAAIDQVTPDRNPASAPAWSLDRLRVDYRNNGQPDSVLISPADKFAFMQDLMAGGLKMDGDRMVRRSSW